MPASHPMKADESHTHPDEAHHKKSEYRSHSAADWKKNFKNFKTPAMDIEQLISHYRRSAETRSAVIQILTESARVIARLQVECLRSNAEHVLKASQEFLNHSISKTPAPRQADFAKSWLDSNVESLLEITEISTKSMREAFDVINKRIAEQSKEFVDAARDTSPASEKKAA